MSGVKWDFRDVSIGLQKLREFLLGRKHHLHGRFPPAIAPRSIPPPDIPRGPEYKYSKQYYYERNALHSVLPPVVAPVAEGLSANTDKTKKPGGMKPESQAFQCAPTPGPAWWWDGHSYYECQPESPPQSPCPPSQCSQTNPCSEPKTPSTCAPPPPPPCKSGA